jgi:ketosteroid isomerase-like protein
MEGPLVLRNWSRFCLRSFLLLLLLAFNRPLSAEEVRLDSCDGLPVVEVTVAGAKLRFLLDTAATSMLNSKSFAHGDSRKLSVTSWSGTVETKSRQVTLPELVIGDHRLQDLHLPAVDLSPIGQACGKRIDGILGIDLLSRLGATVDLKNHTAQFVPDTKSTEAVIAELHQQLTGCEAAFNRADEPALAECLDPQIVTFTVAGDFYGRDATLVYYRKAYFQQDPPAQLSMVPRAHHLIGDAVWVEYDLKIVLRQQTINARGTALCRKSNGKWRIVHMNHSSPPAVELQAHTKEQDPQ